MTKHLYFAHTLDITGNRSAVLTIATNSTNAHKNIIKGAWHKTVRELIEINEIDNYKILVFKSMKLPTTGTRERTA